MSTATAFLTSHIGVNGKISFKQTGSSVAIDGNINVIPPDWHSLEIRSLGDISLGPYSTGPVSVELKPVEAKDGTALVHDISDQISLVVGAKNNIIGKALVVYATGGEPVKLRNAIAWGVIGLSPATA